ncbi:MAG: Multicopper oxidase type 3 [Nitrososphaeraceae archaeon]|nr:Multicopper oxidase type 3 [Nitrososphaeraceae archaeon]
MSNQTNRNSNHKIKLFRLALCAIVVIISIGTSLVVYTLAQSSNNNNMSSKLNPASNPDRQITLVAEDAEIEIAPGKRVKTWTFNGTVPAPTIRLTEGENVTIKFINKSPIPHTIHFHGNHDDTADGVLPQVMPNQTYLYNITGEPAGALMYHCHAPPTSLHIRMGMYGALIVDPKDKPLPPPAKELVMVMSEYDLEDQLGFEADYYLINGYADQYMRNPITINHGELLRMYIINIGTTIPAPFHLHSTTFMAYPSGLWDNEPQHVQTIPIAPGDASIVEAKWKYPGTYLFHSHGIQEERGNMGQINVIGTSGTYGDKNVIKDSSSSMHGGHQISNSSNTLASHSPTNASSSALTETVSMFDWQYELQKRLQKPQVINYSQQEFEEEVEEGQQHNVTTTTESKEIQERAEDISLSKDSTLATNITDTNNTEVTTLMDNDTSTTPTTHISMVSGSSNPNNKVFYDPTPAKVKTSTTITWTNDDTLPHTVTSGNADTGPSGEFDSGIVMGGGSFTHTFDKAGSFDYYCALHPYMIGQVIVE